MKKLLCLLMFTLFFIGSAQNDKPERDAFRLEVAIDNENFYGADIPKSPYFPKEKLLQLYPGETLNTETEINGDSIFSMKVVKKVLHPENTIIVTFESSTLENVTKPARLSVRNPFTKDLYYNAAMFAYGHDDWHETSIIPVMAGLINFEMWNDKIITLALYNWRFKQ